MAMNRTRAWEQLHDHNISGALSMIDFYNLLLEAGCPQAEAQRLANRRGLARLQAGVTM